MVLGTGVEVVAAGEEALQPVRLVLPVPLSKVREAVALLVLLVAGQEAVGIQML